MDPSVTRSHSLLLRCSVYKKIRKNRAVEYDGSARNALKGNVRQLLLFSFVIIYIVCISKKYLGNTMLFSYLYCNSLITCKEVEEYICFYNEVRPYQTPNYKKL